MSESEDLKFIKGSVKEIYDSLHEKYGLYRSNISLTIFSSVSMSLMYSICHEVPPDVAERLKDNWIETIKNFDLDESEVK